MTDKMFTKYSIKATRDIKKGEDITIRYYGIDKTGNPIISIDYKQNRTKERKYERQNRTSVT